MIQLSSLLAAIPHGPVRSASPAPGAAGGFALPGTEQAAAEAVEILVPGRQILAAPGKPLPELDVEAEGEEDAPDAGDIAFAWFALPTAPQPATTPPLGLTSCPAALSPEDSDKSETLPAPTLPIAGDGTGTETTMPEIEAIHPVAANPDVAEQPAPIKLRVTAPAPQPVSGETPATTPTSQLASALSAAAPAVVAPAETRRTFVQDLLPAGGATAFADIVRPHAIAAPADVQQGVLDMRRQDWMGQMVEQLEAMRDAGPARETRLSLAPEALGKVDVSIRQEGDRIHVHFATETQAARQLLADAQPRLSELAEARGVKLGQTSVDAGAGQGSPRERQPELQPQNFAPRAPDAADATTATPTDDRIA